MLLNDSWSAIAHSYPDYPDLDTYTVRPLEHFTALSCNEQLACISREWRGVYFMARVEEKA